MGPIRLLAVAVLAIVLALSSTQNTFAVVELYYDSGPPPDIDVEQSTLTMYAVRFSLPPGWSSARLVAAEIYVVRWPDQPWAVVHVYGDLVGVACDGTDLIAPGIEIDAADWPDWNLVPLRGVRIKGDFCIAVEWASSQHYLYLGATADPSPRRTWYRGPPTPSYPPWEQDPSVGNVMLRALVEQLSAPVGGFVEPVNKLSVIAPYFALFGLVVAAIVVAAPWKKPES